MESDVVRLFEKMKKDNCDKNNIEGIYLNGLNNEFCKFNSTYFVPNISVSGVNDLDLINLLDDFFKFVPEFLQEHTILENRLPATDINNFQFVKKIPGRVLYFIHLLKFDMKFGGNSLTVVDKGDTDYYPSYNSDRVYYKSRLIPVLENRDKIIPIQLKEINVVESDEHFHTFAFFDEVNEKELSKDLFKLLDSDLFNISPNIYSFFRYDLFTACFNVLYPTENEIVDALELYEPIFIFIYSKYKDVEQICDFKTIEKVFDKELDIIDNEIFLKENFKKKLKKYFDRFYLLLNDELILKGWKKISYEN